MKKRIASALCLLALLAAIPHAAPAAKAGEGRLLAGYGKRDVTPEGSVPLAGYGNTFSRMSKVDGAGKTVRMDDTGDGAVDGRDGQFVTCIAVRDEQGNTLLWFGCDMISAHGNMVIKIQSRAAKAWGLPPQNVIVNASHTHSGVDVSQYFNCVSVSSAPDPARAGYDADSYTAAYAALPEQQRAAVDNLQSFIYETLLPGFLGAAEDALADLAPAEMSTGSIRAPGLNFIRHYYDTASGFDISDVYGDNTRGGSDYKRSYGDANDTMYLLQFTRQGKKPIVAVDWRGHPKLNSTATSTWGTGHRSYVSSDYVGAFRAVLEDAGYLPVFFEGTAGNVNTFSDLYHSKTNYLADSSNPTDKDTVQTYNGKASQIGYLYGQKLASYALQALDGGMGPVPGGEVNARRELVYADYDTHENYKLTGGVGADGKAVAGMLYETVTDAAGREWTAFDYLQQYYAYTTTPSAESSRVTSLLNKYGVNSVYHLNRIKSKFDSTAAPDGAGGYAPLENAQGSFYLYAFSIGPEVACVTAPFEIFDDCYSFRGQTHGTTFVLGYTNGTQGYMPTREVFFFAKGRGCYEANNTAYAPGTAEMIARTHGAMLSQLSGRPVTDTLLPELCPHCGTAADWTPLIPKSTMASGHYFLPTDLEGSIPQMNVNAGVQVCLHLNGHSMKGTGTNTSRLFATFRGDDPGATGGVLNIMGEGLLQSQGARITLDANGEPKSSPYQNSGVIHINSGSTLNLYGGTVRYCQGPGQWSRWGGAIGAFGEVNMYGGTVTMAPPKDGSAVLTQKGGLVYVGGDGVFRMTGGTLTGGRVAAGGAGDNLAVVPGGRVELGGTARIDGGVHLPAGAAMTLAGTVRVARGDTCALRVDDGAELIDATGLASGAEIWITPARLGQVFARVQSADQAQAFRCDGAGSVVCDGELRLYVSDEPAAVPGDLTGDGKANGKDVTLLQRFLAGGYGVELDGRYADVNKDGKANGKDVTLLQRFLAGGYGVTL